MPATKLKPGSYDKTTREIRNKMISLGLNETLSYILVNDKEAEKFSSDNFETIKLLDPMTEERNTLRYSMIPSLVKIYEYNKARSIKDISIFEIGKGFGKVGNQYIENTKLCVLMSGDYILGLNKKQVDFYVIKGIAEEILDYLGFKSRYSFIAKDNLAKEFHPYQTAAISVNNDEMGIIGKLHPEVSKEDVYALEINLDKLLSKKTGKMKYKEISKYPAIKKDLAVLVEKNISAKEIEDIIKKSGKSLLTEIEVFDVYTGKNIDENKKSIAFSLTFEDTNKTLVDEEINKIMEDIISNLSKKLNAQLRS